eukprot:TRINITY_DN6362_c0_g1_i1.p1 TRINITY_DN6362_c0_g1~~TRINITY_DN6362_c0_g1_i1.p1  ORF type:complete len:169 (-),score=26.32 TRINITY_DN6362_c0_g1_i1:24-500(-)
MENGGSVPYSIEIKYQSEKPNSHPACQVHLEAKLSLTEVNEGESDEIFVKMTNLNKEQGQPMTIARISLPGGLEPRYEQLSELVSSNTISFFEVNNRCVDIYLRSMSPAQQVLFKIDVIATIPGKYVGSASCIYLYYTDEEKNWIDPMSVQVRSSLKV